MKSRRYLLPLALSGIVMLSFLVGIEISRKWGTPFVKRSHVWSVGIYAGTSPFNLHPANQVQQPVLSRTDATDVDAAFVADPFMVHEAATWYMFCEVLNKKTDRGVIALATSSDALHWSYKQIVLSEPFHLSYPYVFKWQDNWWMIPETNEAGAVRLYRARNFPTDWVFDTELLKGCYVDSSIVRWHGRWYLFACALGNRTLLLFTSEHLAGPYSSHPDNPVVANNPDIARPGGRILSVNGQLFRFAQDDAPHYGNQVWALKITKLTEQSYEEELIRDQPVLSASGTGWNNVGMHQIDPHRIGPNQWIACVDGQVRVIKVGLRH